VGSVDAVWRKRETGSIEIGGRKAELMAQSVAGYDLARKRVSPPEHLTGGIQIATHDRVTDPSAANGFIIQGNGRHAVKRESEFCAELLQKRDVATALVSETKVRPNANALNLTKILGETADERFTRLAAEFAIEM
jgi:hypothetical protein